VERRNRATGWVKKPDLSNFKGSLLMGSKEGCFLIYTPDYHTVLKGNFSLNFKKKAFKKGIKTEDLLSPVFII
jgi:hypothetical protein